VNYHLLGGCKTFRNQVGIQVAGKQQQLKKSMHVVQTEGVPPNHGKMVLLING
jgi:hypothetical protein